MINTHILSDEFEYVEPRTVEEAVEHLKAYGPKARVIAGGTDLLVQIKTGKIHPSCLVNIARVPALRYLIEEGGIRMGSLTSFRDIEKSRTVQDRYTALYEAARSVTSVQIKHMGTLGGNLCHASPASDSSLPLIAFGGKVKLVETNRERVIPLEAFFTGPGKTMLSPTELLTEVQLSECPEASGSCFIKMGRVSADLAKISVAVVVQRRGETCMDCRIVLGAVAEKPLRVIETEEVIRGKKYQEALVEKMGERVKEEIRPITDIRSTLWYRKEVSRVLLRDAFHIAWRRAGEGPKGS